MTDIYSRPCHNEKRRQLIVMKQEGVSVMCSVLFLFGDVRCIMNI